MSEDRVILATLKRGKNYKYQYNGHYYTFKREVPEQVSEELADELEQLVDRITTDDGEVIEKDFFEIDREASRQEVEAPKKRIRLRIVREEVEEGSVRTKPKPRIAPSVKSQTGFAKRSAR